MQRIMKYLFIGTANNHLIQQVALNLGTKFCFKSKDYCILFSLNRVIFTVILEAYHNNYVLQNI